MAELRAHSSTGTCLLAGFEEGIWAYCKGFIEGQQGSARVRPHVEARRFVGATQPLGSNWRASGTRMTQSLRLTSCANRRRLKIISLVATGRHSLHGLLQHVERFHRIPSGGMRCASTRPESVGPIDGRRRDWPQVNPSTVTSSGGRSARDGDRLRGAAPVSRGSNRGPAILQLGE